MSRDIRNSYGAVSKLFGCVVSAVKPNRFGAERTTGTDHVYGRRPRTKGISLETPGDGPFPAVLWNHGSGKSVGAIDGWRRGVVSEHGVKV